jgi:hypothetical protein
MTGSFWAPIIIPIPVIIGLATWLIMVYRAASHPRWRARSAAAAPLNTRPAARIDAQTRTVLPDARSDTNGRAERDAIPHAGEPSRVRQGAQPPY